jgi:hypothetical protein
MHIVCNSSVNLFMRIVSVRTIFPLAYHRCPTTGTKRVMQACCFSLPATRASRAIPRFNVAAFGGTFYICLHGQLTLLTLPRANVTKPVECPFKQMHFDVARSAERSVFICT